MRKRVCLVALFLTVCSAWLHAGETGPRDLSHSMTLLVIQLGIIIFAARLGNALFERFRIPGVLGEFGAGMLIGPYALGGLALHGFPGGVFPAGDGFPVSPELYGICSVAAIILLFTVGLETDLRLLMRYSVVGAVVGVGGVVFSFLLGVMVTMAFGHIVFGRTLTFFSPESLFLGTIATATSLGITSRVLSERRKLGSPEGVIILGGAVLDDVLGIILLAVVLGVVAATQSATGVDWGHIGAIAAKAVLIWLVTTALGLAASRRISLLLKLFRERGAIALMGLGLALILAGLFEKSGLAMIVGAYVAGLALSQTDVTYVLREQLHAIYGFLVPVFFCVMGMLVDFGQLFSLPILLFGAVYVLAGIAAKVIGCGLPVMAFNFNLLGALRVGFGMLPRSEIALLIAGIGLARGMIAQEVMGVAVLLVIVTSALAPPVLIALFSREAAGTRTPVDTANGQVVRFTFPSPEIAETLVRKLWLFFENDGFFVHLIDRERHVYQMRRDTTVIGMERDGAHLVFICGRAHIPLVNTAVYEATADFTRTIAALQTPVDGKAIARRVQSYKAPVIPQQLHLEEYVPVEALEPDLKAATKAQAIDELLGLLSRAGLVGDVDRTRAAVWERERSLSTGMQHGVAIPHAKTDAVDRLVCAIGIRGKGLDFDSLDGAPTRIIVLTLAPSKVTSPYMQFLSIMSQILDETGRMQMLSCQTPGEMLTVITRGRVRHGAGATRAAPSRDDLVERYIRPALIKVGLRGATRREIIDELLDLIHARGLLDDVERARAAVLRREEEMATGLEHGIAIPHARTDAVADLVCAIGTRPEGVDFGSIDSQPSTIIILTLTPEAGSAPHLRLVSRISQALDSRGRAALLASQTPEDVYAVLQGMAGSASGAADAARR